MGEQPGRLHCQPQAAGSTAWPTAYLGTGTAELVKDYYLLYYRVGSTDRYDYAAV